jgi:hypothetical protein
LVDETDENVLEERVGGEYVTFRVYVFLLKAGEASVRDVYRGCGLSSPSLALHHLEKLEGLKLVRKDEHGVYHAVAKKFGVLRFFYRAGRGWCRGASSTRYCTRLLPWLLLSCFLLACERWALSFRQSGSLRAWLTRSFF